MTDKKFIDVIKLISLVTDLADESCMRRGSLLYTTAAFYTCVMQ